MRWILRPWRQFFSFSGRATRREYWLFQVQLIVLYVAMLLAVGALGGAVQSEASDSILGFAMIPAILFYLIGSLSSGVRRIHDHDKSGWLFLLSFVPFIGWIFFLIMMLTPGTRGTNSYGRDPRDGDAADVGELEQVFS